MATLSRKEAYSLGSSVGSSIQKGLHQATAHHQPWKHIFSLILSGGATSKPLRHLPYSAHHGSAPADKARAMV